MTDDPEEEYGCEYCRNDGELSSLGFAPCAMLNGWRMSDG